MTQVSVVQGSRPLPEAAPGTLPLVHYLSMELHKGDLQLVLPAEPLNARHLEPPSAASWNTEPPSAGTWNLEPPLAGSHGSIVYLVENDGYLTWHISL